MNTRKRQLIGLSRMDSLFSLVCCMAVYRILGFSPLCGGLFLTAWAAVSLFFVCLDGAYRRLLGRSRRWWCAAAPAVFCACALLWVLWLMERVSPAKGTALPQFLALVLLLRDLGCRLLLLRPAGKKPWLTALHLAAAAAVLWLLLRHAPGPQEWGAAAVCVLCGAGTLCLQLTACRGEPGDAAPKDTERAAQMLERLRETNACRIHGWLSGLTVAALYGSAAALAADLLLRVRGPGWLMLTAVPAGILAAVIPLAVLEPRRRQADPAHTAMGGLLLWLGGLLVYLLGARPAEGVSFAACLGLFCTAAGMTFALIAGNRLEERMPPAARFAAGELWDEAGYGRIRSAGTEAAAFSGQTLALLCLVLAAVLLSSPAERPALLLPAVLATAAALVLALQFPLSTRFSGKLERYLRLTEEGGENKTLREQLDRVVVQQFRQPLATRFLRMVIRRVYPHRLEGLENIRTDDDNPLVFLCNHGEIYGPVAAICNIPVPVRPWVISYIVTEPKEMEDYIYKYNIQDIRWIPEKPGRALARLLSRLSVWCMTQLECVPVYRDKPAQLMKTFRASVEALQAGDNLLIFPENPNAAGQDHGFEREGIGTLFAGFAMLGDIYYKRTGKRCRFVPMYCDKHNRTITFAPEIVFDVEADGETERHRVAAVCEAELNRMWAEGQRKLRERREKRRRGRPEGN